MSSDLLLCYCGSAEPFSSCCQPLLLQSTRPANAGALMRSRYSAFCVPNIDYLLLTRHPSTRHLDSRQELERSSQNTKWCGLRVIEHREQGDAAEVEFVAFYRAGAGLGQIHERSRFLKEADQWLYLEGAHLAPVKLQRNDPCCCGSGKKQKKCCGLGAE